MKNKLNPACGVCHNYSQNGGKCPGDTKGSFYYPTDCSSYDDGTDPSAEYEEILEDMIDEYNEGYEQYEQQEGYDWESNHY